jgi:hypothetical protein
MPAKRQPQSFVVVLITTAAALLPCQFAVAHDDSGKDKVAAPAAKPTRDGSHDFDFEIGTWKTHLKRRLHPLTGTNEWAEYDGTTRVSKVWDGKSNLVELEVDGKAGHIEGASWRLYNPEAHQWSLNFSNSKTGTLSTPTIGEFSNGRGEFYSSETLNDRAILVRFVIAPRDANTCDFEQAFSPDGGKTWEVNWIATDTRVHESP